MAKRPSAKGTLNGGPLESTIDRGLIDSTVPPQTTEPEAPRTGKHTRNPHNPYKSMGVELRVSEWNELQGLSEELGVGLPELAVWILRDFLKRWRAGDRPEIEKPLA